MPKLNKANAANIFREMGRTGDALGVVGGVAELFGVKGGEWIGKTGTAITGVADLAFFKNINEEWRAITGSKLSTSIKELGDKLVSSVKKIGATSKRTFTKAATTSADDIAQVSSKAGKSLTFLGKVSGVLSIATGGYSLYTGIEGVRKDLNDGDGLSSQGVASGLDAFSGAAAVVGGVAMFFPPVGTAIAATAFAASGVASLISLGVEHGPAIGNWVSNRLPFPSSSDPIIHPPATLPPTPGTPYAPPTSTATPQNPTPPASSTSSTPRPVTPTPTPQVTQTPTPPPDGN